MERVLNLREIRSVVRELAVRLDRLLARRSALESHLVELEEEISRLEGRASRGRAASVPVGPKARARSRAPQGAPERRSRRWAGERSLSDYAAEVLGRSGQAMTVADLAAAVEKLGYTSKNTAQVLRLTAGRRGRLVMQDGDRIGIK